MEINIIIIFIILPPPLTSSINRISYYPLTIIRHVLFPSFCLILLLIKLQKSFPCFVLLFSFALLLTYLVASHSTSAVFAIGNCQLIQNVNTRK
jgi:hypothetical protein